jgi:FkbM family methyltransferase
MYALTSTFEERLKSGLIPGRLYIRYRVLKEKRRGEAELALVPFLADRRRNAIDAGANKGTYAYVIAGCARHVFAYEPNPKMFDVLRRTAAHNVTASPIALSDVSGQATLRVPLGSKGHSNQRGTLRDLSGADSFTPVKVEARRIDDLDLSDIGFMKIDVEGFEAAVLRGAEKTIDRDRPNLLIEIEEKHTGRPIEESLAAVLRYGYEGLFVKDGAMKSLSLFDPERDHRNPEGGYVFNFIFLPTERARHLPGR